MGWMPAPIDVGVWPSLWSLERRKQTGHTPSLREALVDFHIGYIGTFVLALFFLGLGALVMFGTGETPAVQGVPFANQLIQLYTKTLGGWSYYFIAVAAFTCMFSTTLTCFDGYTRAVHGAFCLAVGRKKAHREDVLYWVLMIFFMATTIVVVRWFASSMTNLVNFATIMAFLTAPVMALLNFRLIFSSHVPQEGKPGPWLRWLAYAGLVFLSGFAVFYVYQWLAASR